MNRNGGMLMTLLLMMPAISMAAEPAAQKPCAEDIEKYCKDVKPGEGGILKCLKEHDDELSDSCRDKLNSVLKRQNQAKHACAGDIAKFCADVKPGGGRLIKCLKPHSNELAPQCLEILNSIKTRRAGMKSSSADGGGQ